MSKKCYLCGSTKFVVRNDRTRDRSNVRVMQCARCRLTALESFDHLESVSYESGDMREKGVATLADYKEVLNVAKEDDARRFEQWKDLIRNKTVLDFGSGAGGFLKLAVPVAKKVFSVELDQITKFYPPTVEVQKKIEDFDIRFDVITLFHVLEHIPDPISLLKKLKKYLKPNGTIVIEVPNDDDVLINYYKLQSFKDFTYWSLHLYSYNKKTLTAMCKKAGFKKVQVQFYQRYFLSNHVGWLKDGKPGGHHVYQELNDEKLAGAYNKQLAKMEASDTLVAVLKV